MHSPEWIYFWIISIVYIITRSVFYFVIQQKWTKHIFDQSIRKRDIHTSIKPKIGGLIIIPLFVSLFLLCIWGGLITWQKEFLGLLLGAIAILIYGYIDEKYDLSWKMQFIWQFGIAGIVIVSDIGIQALSLPNGGLWFIDTWNLGPMVFPKDIITALWIVGLMNVVNWLDGVDGLAGGVGVIGFVTLTILSLTPFVNQPHIALIATLLMGLYLGFLRFNWYPSKIFLGTYGSMFLGYMLAVLALISGGKVATSALVLAFPIIDAIVVISQRIWNKKSIFKADNRHFHHKLLQIGLRQRFAVGIMYIISIIFGISALILDTRGKIAVFIIGAGILIVISFLLTQIIVKKVNK
jgi:UDP-GlcNAc:undecaprenyl-phosphate GlcNAc-1-phosphate transferase